MYSSIVQAYKCSGKEWRSLFYAPIRHPQYLPGIPVVSAPVRHRQYPPIRDIEGQCSSPPLPISPTRDIEGQCPSPPSPISPTKDIEGQ
ncbi:hypothetical protein PoB_005787100 [Plakobranchus ocellatus]|uniref:Uncharacterized protein n=1 Tax=Plakobranchus ocellatus TaxID=259542 RepID=A0AAV4CIR6_9GAST|nr:hypothetical protein PoB_005787100 [Plakobranchus ocellatus]